MPSVTEFQLLDSRKILNGSTAFSYFPIHLLSHGHREHCHYCTGKPEPVTALIYEDISQITFLSGDLIHIPYCAPLS